MVRRYYRGYYDSYVQTYTHMRQGAHTSHSRIKRTVHAQRYTDHHHSFSFRNTRKCATYISTSARANAATHRPTAHQSLKLHSHPLTSKTTSMQSRSGRSLEKACGRNFVNCCQQLTKMQFTLPFKNLKTEFGNAITSITIFTHTNASCRQSVCSSAACCR